MAGLLASVRDASPARQRGLVTLFARVGGPRQLDIVFGTWGHQVVALDRFGDELPGFPVDVFDTVWSSPALFDSDGDGDLEIFIGSDWYPGGPTDHLGGWLRAYDVTGSGVTQLWQAPATETFHSSPAIARSSRTLPLRSSSGRARRWSRCVIVF